MSANETPSYEEPLDCSGVLADIFLLLDNECDAGARERLQCHLENCSSCFEHYEVQRQMKALLQRKCGEAAPEGLRERLRLEIRRTVVVRQTIVRDGEH